MIYFLIPVFNESINIPELKTSITSCLPDENKFYLFVDDCSTDHTIQVINDQFEGLQYSVLEKVENKGPGDSFNKGFEWILNHSNNDNNLIVTIEGDNTSDLSILPKMIAISRLGYELVLASVYAQGGKLEKTTFFRKILSLFANLIMRVTLNLNVLTLSSFYRVYQRSVIGRIKEDNKTIISENGFLSKVEILIKAVQSEASVIEVPTTLLSEKRKGKSKMKIFRTMRDYIRIILKSKSFSR